jgi:hypothetical protein
VAITRKSSVEQVRADLAADRLTRYEWGDGWRTDGGLVSPFPAALESGRGPDQLLLWHTSDGRQHFTTVENPGADPALGVELQASDSRQPADPAVSTVVAALAITGAVLFLWALLSSTDPVTGTKWFWFWLVAVVPLGLGLLWWLARERPWSPRAPVRATRLKWWAGIGISIVAGLLLSLALAGLRGVLGDDVVPGAR